MTAPIKKAQATLLAVLVVVSVFATGITIVGAVSTTGAQNATAAQQEVTLENDTAKAMTLSWFRDSGNGPYPVPPGEYDGNESAGINLFTNAEGDSELRVDNSTAKNPNGQWDMVVLHVEASGVSELNPPVDGGDKGLVTQNFINNENWNVDISQVNGDKKLDIAANQENFENPNVPRTSDIPPVMIFADTEGIEGDWLSDDEPDSGIYVWIDPNRATLTENGQKTSFAPGEEYKVTWTVHGQTQTTTFKVVDGTVSLNESYAPANKFGAELGGSSTLAAGTPLQMVLTTENGTTLEAEAEVEGNMELGGDTKGTIPEGLVSANFDLSGMENQKFTLNVYAPGPEGGHIDGVPVRDDDDYLDEENRIKVAEASGQIRDIIDPNYTISDVNVTGGKPLSLPYGIGEEGMTAGDIGGATGDGELGLDSSVAYDAQGTQAWDSMFLQYEVSSSAFTAIDRSPGKNVISKFRSSPLSLTVVQTNVSGEPKRLRLGKNTSGVNLILDREGVDDRLYNNESGGIFFWINPNEAVLYKNGEKVQMEPGETYKATLTAKTENGKVSETIRFKAVEGTTAVSPSKDGVVQIQQSKNAEIQLKTQLAAGSEWEMEITSEDGSISTVKSLEPTGTGPVLAGKIAGSMPNAVSTVTIDTSGLELGTKFTISVSLSEDPPNSPVEVVNTTGVIVKPPSGTVSISEQTAGGSTVTVDSAKLSDGGFISVHKGSPTGVTLGSSSYLEEGSHSNVKIDLDEPIADDTEVYVVLHLDTNNNKKFDFPVADDPYKKDGAIVSASAAYSVQTATPTATSAPATATPTEGGTETGSPGFGLGISVVALLAVVALLRRRD